MKVKIKFCGILKNLVNKEKLIVDLTGEPSIWELIKTIVIMETKLEEILITSRGPPMINVLILVNGQEISALNGLKTLVKDRDTVIFVPVSHGG